MRLLYAVQTRKRRGGLKGHQIIHTEIPQTLQNGRARLEVRHPDMVMAGTGPTRRHPTLGRLSPNTLSVVVRVHLADRPAVLLAADMDAVALEHIRQAGHDLAAPVLVFPHHGGLPGSADPAEFAKELTALVRPDLVVFSIRSGRQLGNPHPDIVAGVRSAAPDAHIACTQMSCRCHDAGKKVPGDHLALRFGAGRSKGRSCAGTLIVTHATDGLLFEPPLVRHRQFITTHVDNPLCLIAHVPGPRREQDPSQSPASRDPG